MKFAHAHETTFARGLWRSFRFYGPRAPAVVAGYYRTAMRLWLEAGRQPGFGRERQTGELAIDGFAEESGITVEVLRELMKLGPLPTHHQRVETFKRLYLDRSLAVTMGFWGATAAVVGGSGLGVTVAIAAMAYLVASVARSGNRYAGTLPARLRAAASQVAELTRAELVVFGHSHQPDQAPRYVNPGSFAFVDGPGRPYLHVSADGQVEQRSIL